jgi:hypothetical protein
MTNLKNHFIEFSENWENYVQDCMYLSEGNNVYLTKDHPVYKLIIETIVTELESHVDKRIYTVKGSVGQSGLAGIPWLAVLDKEVTESTREKFYISYLFSRNATRLHLSIALGADQFVNLYGKNKKTTSKISTAKEQFVDNFQRYSPSENFDQMDLIDEGADFAREFSKLMKLQADHYYAGSFFTKAYDLKNPNFEEEDLIDDLKKYIDSYRKIVNDPTSSSLLEVLDELVFEESDKKQNNDLNYDLPKFNPVTIQAKEKKEKVKTSSKPRKPSLPSKKVGDAGEKYVYEYEKNKLEKLGLKNLADLIVKQYENLSFFPGYDIQSFDELGNKIFIEVKSTKGKNKSFFEISDNEIRAAKEHGDSYYIYQVTSALTNPKISTVINNLHNYEDQDKVLIEPILHRVTFKE